MKMLAIIMALRSEQRGARKGPRGMQWEKGKVKEDVNPDLSGNYDPYTAALCVHLVTCSFSSCYTILEHFAYVRNIFRKIDSQAWDLFLPGLNSKQGEKLFKLKYGFFVRLLIFATWQN